MSYCVLVQCQVERLCTSGQQKVEKIKELYLLENQLDFGSIKVRSKSSLYTISCFKCTVSLPSFTPSFFPLIFSLPSFPLSLPLPPSFLSLSFSPFPPSLLFSSFPSSFLSPSFFSYLNFFPPSLTSLLLLSPSLTSLPLLSPSLPNQYHNKSHSRWCRLDDLS